MKKTILSILISVLLITSFSACRNGDAETAGTTVPENTTAESTAEISSAPQTIEKTLDGVTLKVYIENPKVKSGGEVHITATVTNNSGKDIISTLPIYNQQHYEIRTKILTQGGKAFYDKDYPIEVTEDATRQFIIRSGESYVQDMHLVAAEMHIRHERHRRRRALRRGKMRGNLNFQMGRRQRRGEVADGFVWGRNSLNFIIKPDLRI